MATTPEAGRRYGDKSAAERHDARRARLVEAALDSFQEHGYAGTSIEQLCAHAGVSTRNFYEHFESREQLLIALHDDLNARALEAVAVAVAAEDPNDLRARAYAGARAYFEVITTDPRWARIAVVESVGVSPEAEHHRQVAIGRFADLIELETIAPGRGGHRAQARLQPHRRRARRRDHRPRQHLDRRRPTGPAGSTT